MTAASRARRALVRADYGPSLPVLLGPRVRAASRPAKAALALLAVVLAAALAALAVVLLSSIYSRGAPVPFSFDYRGFQRVAPERGSYVRVVQRARDGALEYSFAVSPVSLPPYSGLSSGELPIYAFAYERKLARRYAGFALRGEGKAKLTGTTSSPVGYEVVYRVALEGRAFYGRDFLMLPTATARRGVAISMLASVQAAGPSINPLELAVNGPLSRPLHSFSLG